MYSQDRVMNPLRYVDGHPVPAEWGEALEIASNGLAAADGKVAALVGDASNEEGFILQDLVRNGLGSSDIDSRQARTIGREQRVLLDDPATQARVADIDHADVILVLGTDPIHSAPAFDLRVRKAVRRNHTALAVATERPSALDGGAAEVERIAPGQAAAYLAGLLDQVRSGSGEGIAGLLKDSSHTVVIWGERIGRGESGPEAIESLLQLSSTLDLAGQEESGLIEIPDVANARGLREVGCLPDAGPGLSETEAGRDVEEIRAALESGDLRGLVLYGVDPLRDFPDTEGWCRALEAADFIVSFTMAATDSAEFADVVFPLESHAEKDGTITHTEGRLQRVRPAAARPGDIRGGWHVLAELSAALGYETGIHAVPEAFQAITEAVPFYAGLTDEEIGGRGVRWQEREAASAWVGAASVGGSDGRIRSAPAASVGGSDGCRCDRWVQQRCHGVRRRARARDLP
jgi:NADH-quinone oxidoreductase subunit G